MDKERRQKALEEILEINESVPVNKAIRNFVDQLQAQLELKDKAIDMVDKGLEVVIDNIGSHSDLALSIARELLTALRGK